MKKEKLLKILLSPHMTEKASKAGGDSNCPQYVFKVANCANKIEIKSAVEALFNVKVKAVNVLRKKGAATTRFGRSIGQQGTWKKAYVVLQPGQEINIA